jgi:hypothetical protein
MMGWVGCTPLKKQLPKLASSRLKPVPLKATDAASWTSLAGDGRRASWDAYPRGAWARSSALSSKIDDARAGLFPAKAGPTKAARAFSKNGSNLDCGTGFSREAAELHLIFIRRKFRHHTSRLGCRPNADDAEWAEPHGCGESAVRTWMSVRRGPTECRRSEGIPTQEEPSQEQATLVTWVAFPSNSPKAKRLPLGRRS